MRYYTRTAISTSQPTGGIAERPGPAPGPVERTNVLPVRPVDSTDVRIAVLD